MTFIYLMHTVHVAWDGAEPNAYFIHGEDCEAHCKLNANLVTGYERSPQLDESPWVNLMKATRRQAMPEAVRPPQRCTLQVPLKKEN